MKNISLIIFFAIIIASVGEAKVRISGVNVVGGDNLTKIVISLDGKLLDKPELMLRDNIAQIALKDTVIWPKIEKKIDINGKADGTVMAYQFNDSTSRVRALFPFQTSGLEKDVSVNLLENSVEFIVPTGKNIKVSKNNGSSEKYDESYLDKLLKDKKSNGNDKGEPVEAQPVNVIKNAKNDIVDKVGITQSSTLKDEKPKQFSFGVYIGKFVAFLGIILLFFYGVVAFFRKGVIKNGKLGFLNDTQVIKVLNTTYLGPKKSIVLVQVHKQTFLLSVSERDVHFLTEVKDTTGALKQGEREIAGTNFDSEMVEADKAPKNFKLKEITEAFKDEVTRDIPKVALELSKEKESTKFTDLLRSKVKGLKPLQ